MPKLVLWSRSTLLHLLQGAFSLKVQQSELSGGPQIESSHNIQDCTKERICYRQIKRRRKHDTHLPQRLEDLEIMS